jgi:GxxExxY protein
MIQISKENRDPLTVLFHHQVLAYLKAANIKTGLLINFGNKSCDLKRLSM